MVSGLSTSGLPVVLSGIEILAKLMGSAFSANNLAENPKKLVESGLQGLSLSHKSECTLPIVAMVDLFCAAWQLKEKMTVRGTLVRSEL